MTREGDWAGAEWSGTEQKASREVDGRDGFRRASACAVGAPAVVADVSLCALVWYWRVVDPWYHRPPLCGKIGPSLGISEV